METLSDGSIRCKTCDVFIPKRNWKKHQGSRRCDELLSEKPIRDKAMGGALNSINKYMKGKLGVASKMSITPLLGEKDE